MIPAVYERSPPLKLFNKVTVVLALAGIVDALYAPLRDDAAVVCLAVRVRAAQAIKENRSRCSQP